jgi:FtsH-binding integral membrane protein
VYYFLPQSIISVDLGLLLTIFFCILIGMIIGLTLIAFNVQRSLELFLVHTLLFLEKKAMKLLIVKNLTAHRESNKLTSLIYSLTLGSIIFVLVVSSLEIRLFDDSSRLGEIGMQIGTSYGFNASEIDPVLANYSEYFTFAYIT